MVVSDDGGFWDGYDEDPGPIKHDAAWHEEQGRARKVALLVRYARNRSLTAAKVEGWTDGQWAGAAAYITASITTDGVPGIRAPSDTTKRRVVAVLRGHDALEGNQP